MSQRESGFTLVEVLIVVALLGMLTTLAYGTVRLGVLSWSHTGQRRDLDADRDAASRVLRQAIGGAYPAFASSDYVDRRITFAGRPDSIDLVAPLPEAIEAGVMAKQSLYLAHTPLGQDLMLSWALDLPAAAGGALTRQVVTLATGVTALHLRYFGRLQEGREAVWSDQWLDMTALPELVNVQIWNASGTKEPWLEILIEANTTTNTDCAYALEEPVCRRLQ